MELTDIIISVSYIHIAGLDVLLYCNTKTKPEKLLANHEIEKKKEYLKACLQQCCHFTPFVASTDGVLAKKLKR